MLNYKNFLYIFIFILFVPKNLLAEEVRFNCERKSYDYTGFSTPKAAESWYRKNVLIRVNLDTQIAYLGSSQKYPSKVKVKSEGKRFDLTFAIRSKSGTDNRFAWYFLPSGRVDATLKGRQGYKDPGGATYKCNNWPMN